MKPHKVICNVCKKKISKANTVVETKKESIKNVKEQHKVIISFEPKDLVLFI